MALLVQSVVISLALEHNLILAHKDLLVLLWLHVLMQVIIELRLINHIYIIRKSSHLPI